MIIRKCIFFSCKYPLFLSDITETSFFSTDLLIILKYQNSWAELFRVDSQAEGQTD